jgi:hypothetical protein
LHVKGSCDDLPIYTQESRHFEYFFIQHYKETQQGTLGQGLANAALPVEERDPLLLDSKLWVEVESKNGRKNVVLFDLKR